VIAKAIAAAAHALGDRAAGVLAKIGGPLGDAARAAFGELDALGVEASRRRRAEWAALARAPVPAGLRSVHGSWIEHALAELPPRARHAIAEGARDRVDVWLARWACAELVAMTAVDREVAELLARPSDVLVAWLLRLGEAAGERGDDLDRVRAGARAIAPRLRRHPLAARQLAQRLPRPLGLVVLQSIA
jgi:hypothetical protein